MSAEVSRGSVAYVTWHSVVVWPESVVFTFEGEEGVVLKAQGLFLCSFSGFESSHIFGAVQVDDVSLTRLSLS